ncbi:MAG TPA: hypothetical protein VFT64_07520 [Rickettsiales bacterium]|nr:hypothetical protein [Rickettsiales bacterium]
MQTAQDIPYSSIRLRGALTDWLASLPSDYYVTFNFNTHTTLASGRTTLKRFHAMLDRKLYGRHFNRMKPDERTLFIAFPEHVESNLHYHALLCSKHPDFTSTAEKIWESILPSGSLHIIDLNAKGASKFDLLNIAQYNTKELHRDSRYEDFIISSQFSAI